MLHAPIPHGLVDDAEPPPRQCGRCRLMFVGDPTLYYPPGRPAWWLCPPCRASLLGRHPHPTGAAHRVAPAIRREDRPTDPAGRRPQQRFRSNVDAFSLPRGR
jgi:hypothetical protein